MNIWEKTFIKKEWGKYPPEDLIRTVCNFKKTFDENQKLNTLELGSGPGANSLFLCEHFDSYSAIDISTTAIEKLKKRLEEEDVKAELDLNIGCFSNLPFKESIFDFICDNLAITHNKVELINETLAEVYRVMKPGGLFFSKVWGLNTFGINTGVKIESGSYSDLDIGPCANLGLAHFFDKDEIIKIYGVKFEILNIEKVLKENVYIDNQEIVEQFVILSKKKQ